jgi:hypothetical protein
MVQKNRDVIGFAKTLMIQSSNIAKQLTVTAIQVFLKIAVLHVIRDQVVQLQLQHLV